MMKRDVMCFFIGRGRRGFSLVELLVVVAIIALLMTFAVPAVNSTIRASHLASASQSVVDQLNLARQIATSRNVPVEVRFYKFSDYDRPLSDTPSVYRAVQTFSYESDPPVPATRIQYFSAPVIISTEAGHSPMFDNVLMAELAPDSSQSLPQYGLNYRYRSLYFKPSGAINLQGTNLFLTMRLQNDPSISSGANFSTVQIDSLTGRPRVFRP